MTDNQTDIQNKKIYVGHLYDLDEAFMTHFFAELNRAKRKDPKIWSVPANYFKQEQSLIYAFSEKLGRDDAGNKVEFKYALCDYRPTKAGLALIVDEIKTGSRMILYRAFMNGEDRYFTETQLKYTKEIR